MRDLRKEAEALCREFWETYCTRGPNTIEHIMAMFAENFVGHGSEKHEEWYSLDDGYKQLMHELETVPDPWTFSIKNMHSAQNGETVVCMYTMSLIISVGEKVIEADHVSGFMTIVPINGELKIMHTSTTVFQPTPVEGDFPFAGLQEPKHYEEVSILFADFENFTSMVGTIPAKKLVSELGDIFSEFDDIVKRNGLYKVKTIGDAYMVVGGLEPDSRDHAIDATQMAVDMMEFIAARNTSSAIKYDLRIGIHSGSVVGGVVGSHGLAFDIFGDSVNIANRVEQASEAGKICVSAYTYDLIKGSFACEYRGKVETKGKGPIDMYFVNY